MMGTFTENHNGKFDFPVEMQSLQTAMPLSMEAASIPDNMARALVRTDTNAPLAIHKSSYTPTPHAEVYDSVIAAVKKATLGDCHVNTQTSHNGARFWGEVLFDHIIERDPEVDDYTQFRIRFYNSYDGAWALQVSTDALRLWCKNGCTMPDSVTKLHQKHISKINIDLYSMTIEHGLATFFHNQDKWKAWRQIDMNDSYAEFLFMRYLAKEDYTNGKPHNKKALEHLMRNWHSEKSYLGGNFWAAYNAATAWQTHTKEYKSPMDVQRKRENQVARMLRSNDWQSIAARGEERLSIAS